jgi:DNA-binding MarR family transcriptional regulator
MRVRLSEHVMLADLEDEAVALNTQSEQYYGLNATAIRMLKALTESESVEKAQARLGQELTVDAAILERDLHQLIDQLCARGVLERLPDA